VGSFICEGLFKSEGETAATPLCALNRATEMNVLLQCSCSRKYEPVAGFEASHLSRMVAKFI
jgi:hypothetical protein